jgi:hypothetical protein
MLRKKKKTYLWARGTMSATPVIVSALPWAVAVTWQRGGGAGRWWWWKWKWTWGRVLVLLVCSGGCCLWLVGPQSFILHQSLWFVIQVVAGGGGVVTDSDVAVT